MSQPAIENSYLTGKARMQVETYNYAIKFAHWLIGMIPPFLRGPVWKLALGRFGSGVYLGEGAYFQYPWKVSIGNQVQISQGFRVYPSYQFKDCFVTLEDRVLIGPHVTIYGAGHPVQDPRASHVADDVYICEDAYIGGSAVIRYGVRVGKKSVVAMGSVVIKDVHDGAIVGGNPARIIGWVDGGGN